MRMRANEEPEQGRAEQGAAGGARGELRRTLRLSYPGILCTHKHTTKGGVRVLSLGVSPTVGWCTRRDSRSDAARVSHA